MEKYAAFLNAHRKPMYDDWGNCKENCLKMQEEFPELELIRGHVLTAHDPKEWTHWWLQSPEGEVVDPTVSSTLILAYMPWEEGSQEPIGKCPNCGEYCYDHEWMPLCTESCSKAYIRYLNSV
jgi:hypothetical protein